jgi:LacI family transcriptional regulator
MIVIGAYTYESGMDCARILLANPNPPTAIFASNDEMAVGVINAAKEIGLNVPGDLSVSGFDDSILASRIIPPLTTIRRPVREMAELAATKLIATIDGQDEEAQATIMVVPALVVRESTRPI